MNKFFKENLEIRLITCNRCFYLEKTIKQLLSSPFRHCNISILDNASNDKTELICKQYSKINRNINYIKSKYNEGGNANIVNAFKLESNKEYKWILCDDDRLNITKEGIKELKEAMKGGLDLILVSNYMMSEKYDVGQLFRQFSFVPSTIFKSSLINSDIITCMYDEIINMSPHIAFYCIMFNKNKIIKRLNYNFITRGVDFLHPHEYLRERKYISSYRKNMSWFTGFCNAIQLLENDKIKQVIIEESLGCVGSGGSLNGIIFELNFLSVYYNNSLKCMLDMFSAFNLKKRLFLILGILLYPIRKKYLIKNNVKGFEEYLKKKNIKNKIEKIFKNTPVKTIIIYGAGFVTDALLNILKNLIYDKRIIFADNKFLRDIESNYRGFIAINPKDIDKYNPELIIVSVYQYESIKRFLKNSKINIKIIPLIKQTILEKIFETRI